MKPVFDVYLKKVSPPDSGAHAALHLPAAPYEVLDALDKLRLGENDAILWEITEYAQFKELELVLDGNGSFYELNALAQKLSELDEPQRAIFAGLLAMEDAKGPIPLPRLIDLAHSVECCHILLDALNDSRLGRFLAENDFLPEAVDLSDEVFELLDFERIGREHRQTEGGVFVERTADHPGGYVEQHSTLAEVYKPLDLTPQKPDYIFRVSVIHHPDAVPGTDPGKEVFLNLPATEEEFQKAEEQLDDPGWLGTVFTSFDGVIPGIDQMLYTTEDLPELNQLSEKLSGMEPKELTAYKALLEATNCRDLLSASLLADSLDKYIFSPQYSSPIEVARGELSTILCDREAEIITPHVNLSQYGQALIRSYNGVLTTYGLIERTDGRPILSPRQEQTEGGMTLG